MRKSSFEYKGQTYLTVELENFKTADGETIPLGVFTETEFMNLADNSPAYLAIDAIFYGYLPHSVLDKCDETTIRNIIFNEIG